MRSPLMRSSSVSVKARPMLSPGETQALAEMGPYITAPGVIALIPASTVQLIVRLRASCHCALLFIAHDKTASSMPTVVCNL